MDEIRHKVGQFTFYTSKTLPSVSHSYLIIAVTLKVWTKSQLCKLLWNPFCWNQNSKTLFSARNNEYSLHTAKVLPGFEGRCKQLLLPSSVQVGQFSASSIEN